MATELALRNLPSTATLAEVQACLGDLRPLSVEFNRDSVTGKFKGTVFVRLEDPSVAQSLVESGVNLHGRKVKVEFSRRSLKSNSSSSSSFIDSRRVSYVRTLIDEFLASSAPSLDLPFDLSPEDRKLAHSLAEKYGLKHETINPVGSSIKDSHLRSVRLSRSSPSAPPGLTLLPPRQRAWTLDSLPSPAVTQHSLRREAPVFTPASSLFQSRSSLPSANVLPDWLEEHRPRTSLVLNEKLLSLSFPCCVSESKLFT